MRLACTAHLRSPHLKDKNKERNKQKERYLCLSLSRSLHDGIFWVQIGSLLVSCSLSLGSFIDSWDYPGTLGEALGSPKMNNVFFA